MLSEFIYGGMDGVITTVAIIGGSFGANLSHGNVLALGAANVLADGFSMGVSRYNSLINVKGEKNSDLSRKSPLYSSLATLTFFVLMGFIPLSPLVLSVITGAQLTDILIRKLVFIFSFIAFVIIGFIKGLKVGNIYTAIIQTLIIGGLGAFISYQVASYVDKQSRNI